jgi:hypothetical protein
MRAWRGGFQLQFSSGKQYSLCFDHNNRQEGGPNNWEFKEKSRFGGFQGHFSRST